MPLEHPPASARVDCLCRRNKGHFCTASLSVVYTVQAQGAGFVVWMHNGGWLSGPDQLNNYVIDFPNSRLWPYVHNINTYYCPNDTRPVKGAPDPTFAGSGVHWPLTG